jgi:hypothetical protein
MVAKKKAPTKVGAKIPGRGPHPLYGRPIEQIIKTGSLAQMRAMAKTARSHIKEVTAALSKLDAQIQKGGAKTSAAKTTSAKTTGRR